MAWWRRVLAATASRLRSDDLGSVVIVVALAAPIVIGGLALAVGRSTSAPEIRLQQYTRKLLRAASMRPEHFCSGNPVAVV